MNRLQAFITLCLLITTSQLYASRPAEDDPEPARPAEQSQSDIPAPENRSPENIPEAPEVTQQTQQSGDVVNVQPEPQQPAVVLFDFPRRGTDMSKVLNEMGEPTKRYPAVGQPPITRWEYPDRTVFFEYSHVIHVVAR